MPDEFALSPVLIDRPEILSVDQMYRADAAAMASGISGETLMENAGRAIADAIRLRWSPRPVAVLCGPGNNGGDGFVVARLLAESGWDVSVALLEDRDRLKGDAAINARRWAGEVVPLSGAVLDGAGLVVDALFGAGLSKPLEGSAAAIVESISRMSIPCIAVDVPSGIDGNSGAVLGAAPRCVLTVTFCRRKLAHLLLPGRLHCGDVLVADIGIPDDVAKTAGSVANANGPGLWLDSFPWPGAGSHKYSRGHLVIAGGSDMTGAARLAARGATRIGAGMVTIAAAPQAGPIYASDWPSFLFRGIEGEKAWTELLADPRISAVCVGPGGGTSEKTRSLALAALGSGKQTVLDADALTVFRDNPGALFDAIEGGRVVLTPHEGEFARLFDIEGGKLDRCRIAAERSGATVLLKGSDTVIAAPDGRIVINSNGPPELATAGSGDVLAGMIAGLLAQGCSPPDAAAMGAWLHGAAATGPGMVAADIPDQIAVLLQHLPDRSIDPHS